ncbi:MAG: hypothetical protein AB1765_11115 [Candidatus Hydrogenedentota bacterium]
MQELTKVPGPIIAAFYYETPYGIVEWPGILNRPNIKPSSWFIKKKIIIRIFK